VGQKPAQIKPKINANEETACIDLLAFFARAADLPAISQFFWRKFDVSEAGSGIYQLR